MTNIQRTAAALCCFALIASGRAVAADQAATLQGRLVIKQPAGQNEFVALHALDGAMYRLSGEKESQLKDILAELGEKNLVELSGVLTGARFMPCSVETGFEYAESGEQKQKIDTVCIPYADFVVGDIVKSEPSDRALAEPKRDAQAEEEIRRNASVPTAGSAGIIGEVVGTVKKIDIYSTVKSITVKNRDRKSKLKELVLLLGEGTQVVKKIGMADPVAVTIKSLASGQEVTAVYAREDLRATAKIITITKE